MRSIDQAAHSKPRPKRSMAHWIIRLAAATSAGPTAVAIETPAASLFDIVFFGL
jgi:hypothetical protein